MNIRTSHRVFPFVLGVWIFATAWLGAQFAPPPRDDLWGTNGDVRAIVVDGDTIYLGGSFTWVGPAEGYVADGEPITGGVERAALAAIDVTTGVATDWNPGVASDGIGPVVRSLVVSDGRLYVGGWFTSVGDQPRERLAAFDTASGALTAWNPGANSYVNSLAVSGNVIYAGGLFTTIGGQSRNRLAALDATIDSNNATSWNPGTNFGGGVNAVAVSADGSTVFAGGEFTHVGGQPRNRVAAIDAATGLATDWSPNATVSGGGVNLVYSVAVLGNSVYVGGTFDTIGGQPRNRVASFDIATGQLNDWNPNAGGFAVFSFAESDNIVYVGGTYGQIGGQIRNGLAGLDVTTGLATALNPHPYGSITALTVSDGQLYAGGVFYQVESDEVSPQPHLAAFELPIPLQVTIEEPASDHTVASAVSTLAFGGTAAGTGLEMVQWRANEGDWQTAEGTTTWQFLAPLELGPNQIDVRAKGVGEDVSPVQSRFITRKIPPSPDFNDDGVANVEDVTYLAGLVVAGQSVPIADGDFDDDGVVSLEDAQALAAMIAK